MNRVGNQTSSSSILFLIYNIFAMFHINIVCLFSLVLVKHIIHKNIPVSKH